MKTIKTVKELREYRKTFDGKGVSIGFVPTMGYLHDGHMALVDASVKANDITFVSIFVNPTQFAPNEDLESYPRDLDRDLKLCEEHGVDCVFTPDPDEMYQNQKTYVTIEDLGAHLCGKSRPTHFRGVLTVLTKLFHFTRPDRAYFGKKDVQQYFIVKKGMKDLNFDLEICPVDTVREADGLATSSRNVYLSEEERKAAPIIHQALEHGEASIVKGMKAQDLIDQITKEIESEPLAKIDYVSVVDQEDLAPVEVIDGPVLVAVAVFFGKTRLLDNFFYGE